MDFSQGQDVPLVPRKIQERLHDHDAEEEDVQDDAPVLWAPSVVGTKTSKPGEHRLQLHTLRAGRNLHRDSWRRHRYLSQKQE